jgi:hypothetical protein
MAFFLFVFLRAASWRKSSAGEVLIGNILALSLVLLRASLFAVVLRQNRIPTPNASHRSHITPVNMLYPAFPSY